VGGVGWGEGGADSSSEWLAAGAAVIEFQRRLRVNMPLTQEDQSVGLLA